MEFNWEGTRAELIRTRHPQYGNWTDSISWPRYQHADEPHETRFLGVPRGL